MKSSLLFCHFHLKCFGLFWKKKRSWTDLITKSSLFYCWKLRGLMCLHRMKIAHRDLKSANCLVNKHWTVKICDFGLSRFMTHSPMKDSSSAGTPEWMAPELIRNEPFTEKCDIFSLGVIMWELCTLNRPWEGIPPERVCWNNPFPFFCVSFAQAKDWIKERNKVVKWKSFVKQFLCLVRVEIY